MPLYVLTTRDHTRFAASDPESASDKFEFLNYKHPLQKVLFKVNDLKAVHPTKKKHVPRETEEKKSKAHPLDDW